MNSHAVTAAIPLREEDVTASWLSAALSTPEAETRVRTAQHDQLVRGAGTKLRIRVDYEHNPRRLPDVLWVKAGWEEHSAHMEEMGVYAREATFYKDFASLVAVRAPACYYVTQDAQGRSAMILEDLISRGAELWECTTPRSVDDVRSLLEGLAQIHALFWQDSRLPRLPGIGVPVDAIGPTAIWCRANGGERLRTILEGPRGALMPAYARNPQRTEKAFWRMVETLDRTNGRCLLHGDPHPG
ncbi:MAG: hypothetical protein EPO08_03300, partial [Rhodospirillaceae bacterium]